VSRHPNQISANGIHSAHKVGGDTNTHQLQSHLRTRHLLLWLWLSWSSVAKGELGTSPQLLPSIPAGIAWLAPPYCKRKRFQQHS
jgi:hypothetical protein